MTSPESCWGKFGGGLTDCIYLPQNTHSTAQAFKNNIETGCQRGTNTYQCWLPLQLNDITQVHMAPLAAPLNPAMLLLKKVKVAHTRLLSLGFRS